MIPWLPGFDVLWVVLFAFGTGSAVFITGVCISATKHGRGRHEAYGLRIDPVFDRDDFLGSMQLDPGLVTHHEYEDQEWWQQAHAGWTEPRPVQVLPSPDYQPADPAAPADPAMTNVLKAIELGRAQVWAHLREFDAIIERNWP